MGYLPQGSGSGSGSLNIVAGQRFFLTGCYLANGSVRDWGITGAYSGPDPVGSSDGDYVTMKVYKTRSESVLYLGYRKSTNMGIFDLYVNGVLDSSGYDAYRNSGADAVAKITLTHALLSGWNNIILKINGKHESATAYGIGIYGARLR